MIFERSEVIKIFRNCIDFTQHSRSLILRAEQLRLAGINAQVVASQSKETRAILNELVKEIHSMIISISKMLGEVTESGNTLAALALDSTRLAVLALHYENALSLMNEQTCHAQIKTQHENLHLRIENNFRSIRVQLNAHKRSLIKLHEATSSIQPIVMLIKINVAGLPSFRGYFDQIISELYSFRDFIVNTSSNMSLEIDSAISSIDTSFGESK